MAFGVRFKTYNQPSRLRRNLETVFVTDVEDVVKTHVPLTPAAPAGVITPGSINHHRKTVRAPTESLRAALHGISSFHTVWVDLSHSLLDLSNFRRWGSC